MMRADLLKAALRTLVITGILSTVAGIVIFAVFSNGWLLSTEGFASVEESLRVAMAYFGVALITFGLTLALIVPVASFSYSIESKKKKNSSSKHQQMVAFNDEVIKQHSSRRFLLENMDNSTRSINTTSGEQDDNDNDIEASVSKAVVAEENKVNSNNHISEVGSITNSSSSSSNNNNFGSKFTDINLKSTSETEELKSAH